MMIKGKVWKKRDRVLCFLSKLVDFIKIVLFLNIWLIYFFGVVEVKEDFRDIVW